MNYSDYDLRKLVLDAINRSTEDINIEFKDCRDGLYKQLWKPITAFSNSPGGGIIFLGIYENPDTKEKTIVGGLKLDILQQNIISLIEQQINNKADYQIRIFDCQNEKLLAIVLSETPKENKPCYFSELGIDKGACVRTGNRNRHITEEELRSFLRYTPAYNYDRTIVTNSTLFKP